MWPPFLSPLLAINCSIVSTIETGSSVAYSYGTYRVYVFLSLHLVDYLTKGVDPTNVLYIQWGYMQKGTGIFLICLEL